MHEQNQEMDTDHRNKTS